MKLVGTHSVRSLCRSYRTVLPGCWADDEWDKF